MVDVPLYRMGHKLILIVFCACFCTSFAQVGDRCKMAGTDRTGTCREITDCPAAEEQAKKGIDQTICGFASDLITAIVCCEGSVEANDNLFNSNFNTNYEEDSPSQNIVGRISQQKCEEYSQPVVSVVQVLPLVSDASPIAFVTPKCDYNSVPLIVGGQPAEAGEFPFMAAIGFNTTDTPWRCGGTLISDRYVVTAAHCASTAVGKPVVVRLGKLDLSTEKDGSEYKDYIISRIIVHPGYSAPQKYNDIALLRTREKIKFTNFIRPACLNLNAQIPSDQALATGWGQTDFAGESSDKLMKVTLTLFNNQKCTKAYKRDTTALPRGIDSTMICAGDSKGGKDTCQGDSGGPLVITKKGNMCQFFLIGVTSFGILCGEPGIPAVYTRVSEYVSWIERTIW